MVLQFIQGGIFFCLGPIFRKFWRFLLVFSTCFALFSVFLLFPLSINIFVFVHGFWCNFIYSNIDQVFLINPSGNVFVFGDFILHHKDSLTYSGGTDRPGELCCDSVAISNDLTEMVNFPTRITCCDSQSYSFRFISFFWPWYLFYKAFPSREILIMLLNQFPLTFFEPKRDALFIKQLMTILVMLGLVFMTIWEIYHGIFTFRALNIFKHGVSATATKFYEWV